MSILPKYGLLQYRNSARFYIKSVEESLALFKQETKDHKIPLFLIHKPDQQEELDSAINFLNNFRVMLYVDWLDNVTEDDKSEELTQTILQKITACDKIIFLATEEALQSKWCNWVIRLAKTKIKTEDIIILPVRSDFDDFQGEDILQKHPYIYEVEEHLYHIQYPNGDSKELADWMKR